MAPHNQSTFQPVPPIRTNTVDSLKSQSSGQNSPPFSPLTPTSPTSRASPTEESFFGAITSRIRGRSQSRSRGASSRKRSKSPMIMPPEQAPQRNINVASATRPAAVPVQSRTSSQNVNRRSGSGTSSDPWRGRHANDWLFNGVSFTGTAKDLIQRRKS